MFPIRDSVPRVHVPYAVYGIILLNTIVFLLTVNLSERDMALVFHIFGVVPLRFSDVALAAQMGYPPDGYWAFLTYMFLHGSWLHFIINMWTLWIFADNIEDVMGPWRFLAFYILSGLAALVVHMAFNLSSNIPVVGASGAIAGVMGAYFLLYPHSRVLTVIPIIIIPFIVEIPAIIYLGIWFLTQFVSGVASFVTAKSGGIAWWAHAGGFLAGLILLPLFRQKGRCYFCRLPDADPRSVPGFRH